jgi:hypothetical protein
LREFTNPYDPTRPVEDRAKLYGRDDALLWTEQQLALGRRLVIIYGPELIGKTSVVHCLPESLPAEVRCLQFACSPHQGEALVEVWDALAKQVSAQLCESGTTTTGGGPSHDPVDVLSSILLQIPLAGDGKVLLILDDLDALWAEGDASQCGQVLGLLTGLLGSVPSLRLLLTLSKAAYEGLDHPLRHGAETLHLGPLSSEDAQLLVTRPAQGVIRFDPGAVRRVADIASYHPYYLQVFSHALFSRCARDGGLNQSDVDVVLDDLLHQPNERFHAAWDQSDVAERAALVAMSRIKGTHGLTTRQEVVTYVMRFDPDVPAQVVLDALERLAERGALVRMGALSYRFSIKLFSYWLEHHFDAQEVLEHVDWEQLSVRTDDTPPEAAQETRASWGVINWVVAGLGLTTVLGLILWALLFTGLWPGRLVEPTPTLTISTELVDFISPVATPTVTPVPPSPTPTNPVIVVRSMPSIVFRARNVGGGGDLSNWQLFVMNVDGSNRQRLTFTNNEDITPTWSPDGRHIAYVSKLGENRDILVIPAPGAPGSGSVEAVYTPPDRYEAQAVNITDNPANDWTIAWSPDSAQIAFSSNRAGNWQIFTVKTDGSQQRQITDDGAGRLSPVWSPDYKQMAYSNKEGDNWDIYVMPAPGPDGEGAQPERARRLTYSEGNDLSPMYSADGKRIAFESSRDGNAEVYVMNADGSNQRNVSNYPGADDHGPVWSPDGKQILFYSGRAGSWDLFQMSSDGQNLVNLTNTPDVDEQEPFWRP